MSRFLFLSVISFALAALFASAACAQTQVTVVVKPSAMNNWVMPVPYPAGNVPPRCVYSGRAWFRDPVPPGQNLLGQPGALGTGAFFTHCGTDTTNPGQGWIGTEQFAGVKLADITRLDYNSWCDYSGIWQTKGTPPSQYRELSTPRQDAFQIQMVIDRNDGSGLKSYLMYRPYAVNLLGGVANYFDSSHTNWTNYNTLTENGWMEITNELYDPPGSNPQVNPTFNCWGPPYTLPGGSATWWEAILQLYPNATVSSQPGVDYVWPTFATPTGCGFNLVFGAQRAQVGGTLNIANYYPGGKAQWNNWWRESLHARAYVDALVIGIKDAQSSVTETTFDFEADTPGKYYEIGTKAARDKAACGIVNYPTPDVTGPGYGSEQNGYVMCGRVAEVSPDMTPWFMLDDGYKTTKVRCLGGHYAMVGDYWRVQGVLDIDYLTSDPVPLPPAVADIKPMLFTDFYLTAWQYLLP